MQILKGLASIAWKAALKGTLSGDRRSRGGIQLSMSERGECGSQRSLEGRPGCEGGLLLIRRGGEQAVCGQTVVTVQPLLESRAKQRAE